MRARVKGFIVLSGSLELSSRSLVAGAVRLCFALMYSLFLGFGLAIGAELYQRIIGQSIIGPTDYTCVESHDPAGPWWQKTPSLWWAFLTVPMYSLFLSMRIMAPWWKKEMVRTCDGVIGEESLFVAYMALTCVHSCCLSQSRRLAG